MSTLTAGDGTSLRLHAWPVHGPKAVLAIVHGYAEHGGRYAHVASALGERGIHTLAIDLRGHGGSGGARGGVARFDDYHLDVTALVSEARRVAAGAPVFLLGHSMGGMLAMHWLLRGGGKDLRGVVLSSPYLGVKLAIPRWKSALGEVMSKVWPGLALPLGFAGDVLTKDEAMARAHDADPANNTKATARWFTESNQAMDEVKARAHELALPLLLLFAGDDKLVDADQTERVAARLTMADRTVARLDGYYHELVNAPPAEREKVIAQIAEWVLHRSRPAP